MTNRTDTFNRADGSLGTPSDGGGAWATNFGAWAVVSNAASGPNQGSDAPAILESSVSAVEVQATLVTLANGSQAAIAGRYADDSNYIEGVIVPGASGNLYIFKVVAGAATQLGSTYTGSVVTTDVFKLRMDSSNLLTFYQNGVSRVSATDAAGSANTKHGLISNAAVTFDTFSITAIAGSALGADFYRQVAGLGG